MGGKVSGPNRFQLSQHTFLKGTEEINLVVMSTLFTVMVQKPCRMVTRVISLSHGSTHMTSAQALANVVVKAVGRLRTGFCKLSDRCEGLKKKKKKRVTHV